MPQNDSTVPEIQELIYDRAFLSFDTGEFSTCGIWRQTKSEQVCVYTRVFVFIHICGHMISDM